jgi:hypothetical protein
MKIETLVKDFRSHFDIDFRQCAYVKNEFGLGPSVDWREGGRFIRALYAWANAYIDLNAEHFPGVTGFEYNLVMSVSELRSTSFKDKMLEVCGEMAGLQREVIE